jgi:hypothetical protein
MAYHSLMTALFAWRAPASATAPSLPISLFHRLQYRTVVINGLTATGSYHMTYSNFVTELFTLRASASATAPSSSIWLPRSLHLCVTVRLR